MDDIAVMVRQQLDLDMPGVDDELFQIDSVIPEEGFCLPFCGGNRILQFLRAVHPPDTPSATAGRSKFASFCRFGYHLSL